MANIKQYQGTLVRIFYEPGKHHPHIFLPNFLPPAEVRKLINFSLHCLFGHTTVSAFWREKGKRHIQLILFSDDQEGSLGYPTLLRFATRIKPQCRRRPRSPSQRWLMMPHLSLNVAHFHGPRLKPPRLHLNGGLGVCKSPFS